MPGLDKRAARLGRCAGSRRARVYGAVLAAVSAPIIAQAAADATDAEGPLQEITVTATRKEESLSRVPISVTAITQEAIDLKGIKDITDVARFTPGVSVDNSGTNNISIRGISSSGGAGTTGIYIDDTPIQIRALAFNPDDALPKAFDIDRVEVLRGPQGTLFGAGSEGGTVRYITTQPSLTQTSFYSRDEVSTSKGGGTSYEVGAAFGAPIVEDKLGARLTVWYRRDAGYIDRVDPTTFAPVESNVNYDETLLVRFAAVWAPLDGLTVTPSIYYQDRYRNDVGNYWPTLSNPDQDQYVSANPTQRSDPDRFYLGALKVEGDLGFAKLISNTSFYHRKEETGYDGTLYNLGFYQSFLTDPAGDPVATLLDGTGVHLPDGVTNYRSPASIDNAQRNLSQEIRLQSNDPNARFTWTTGLFASVNRQTYFEQIHDPMLNDFTTALTGAAYTDFFGYTDPNSGVYTPTPFDARYPTDSYFLHTKAKDQQIAVFGEGGFAFTDRLKLTAGARMSWTQFSNASLTGGPQLFTSPDEIDTSEHEKAFTPKLSLAYQYDARNLYYFTYSKGFRPGGANNPVPFAACAGDFASFGITQSPPTFGSDSVHSFELGAKNNFDNRVKIASSLYYIRWNNIQQTVVPPVCAISFISNLGAAIAKGGDIQVEAAITDSFTAELTAGYTDARYISTSYFGAAIDPTTGIGNAPIANRGDAITGESGQPNAPFTASIGLEYRFKVMQYASFVRFDDEFQSRPHWTSPQQDGATAQFDDANYRLSPTNFASARTGVSLGKLQLAAFVDNLFDSHTVTNYNYSIPSADTRLERQFTFRPRTVGLTFTYRH